MPFLLWLLTVKLSSLFCICLVAVFKIFRRIFWHINPQNKPCLSTCSGIALTIRTLDSAMPMNTAGPDFERNSAAFVKLSASATCADKISVSSLRKNKICRDMGIGYMGVIAATICAESMLAREAMHGYNLLIFK